MTGDKRTSERETETATDAGEPDGAPRSTNWTLARRNLIAGVALASGALLVAGRNAMAQTSTWINPAPASKPGPRPRPKCFLAGTCIATPAGDVDVETLAPGDLVVTAAGEIKSVLGVGRRTLVRADGAAWDDSVLPVRIARNAIADGVPKRDLFVSRTHAIEVDGLLVPAEDLVNGLTITIADMAATAVIAYVHIEVDGHDVVFANGARAETLQPEPAAVLATSFDAFAALGGGAGAAAMPGAARVIPITAYNGRREALRSRMRSALAVVIDRRRPLDKVRDRLEARAIEAHAA